MRLNLTVWEGQPSMNQAVDIRTQQVHTLPFAVRLIDFNIEDYNPKMAIMDGRSGDISFEEGKSLPFIEEGLKTTLMEWDVEVLEYEPTAFRQDEVYFEADSIGSAPAAYVKVINRVSGEEKNAWLSSGSFRVMYQHMPLDNHNFLVMTIPEPEKYSSDILIVNEIGEALPLTLEVNKPFKYMGWKLYQQSYDERMG
ncbi:unnamed protein product, partial [marine sediment metagenome]